MIEKESKSNLSLSLSVALIIAILFSIIYWSGGMRRYENILSDLIITTFTDPKQASSRIVYAMTSQQCLEEGEIYYNMGWPWKRATYSKLIDFLNLAGAKVIVFNSIFSEKSVYRYSNENDDNQFAQTMKKAGNVIFGYNFKIAHDHQQKKPLLKKFALSLKKNNVEEPFQQYHSVNLPIKTLMQSAASIGTLNFITDIDNTIRRTPLISKYHERYYPSLALATILYTLKTNQIQLKGNKLYVEDRIIPLDQTGSLRLKYYGTNDVYKDYYHMDMIRIYDHINSLYNEYSKLKNVPFINYDDLFKDSKRIKQIRKVLQSIKPNLIKELPEEIISRTPPEAFHNKIVLMGSVAPGLRDLRSTPFHKEEAGVHVYGIAIDNFLNNDFLIEFRENIYLIFGILVLTLITAYYISTLSLLWSSIGTLVLLGVILAAAILLFTTQNVVIDFLTLMIAIIFTFLMITTMNHFKVHNLLKSYSKELKLKNASLIQSNGELDRLQKNVHNNLKNRLDSARVWLSGYIDSLSEQEMKSKDKLVHVNNLVAHCSKESKNILFVIENRKCDKNKLLNELILRADPVLSLANILYSTNVKDVTQIEIIKPEVVHYILDVFTELLNNIVKHSQATEVNIDIAYYDDRISLFIKDNGVGFDYSTGRRKEGSYGLGIIEEITEQVGAELNIKSDPGHGSSTQIIVKRN